MAAAFCLVTGVSADEGMWLLPLIQKMNASAMKDLGCRLSSGNIYSINQSSLKDAIVQFGRRSLRGIRAVLLWSAWGSSFRAWSVSL